MIHLPFQLEEIPAAAYILTDEQLTAAMNISVETQALLQTRLVRAREELLTIKFTGTPEEQHSLLMHHSFLQGYAACLEELLTIPG